MLKVEPSAGDDEIRVGSLANRLDNLQGQLLVDAGAGGDILYIHEQGFAGGATYTLTDRTLRTSRLPAFLLFYTPVAPPITLETLEIATGGGLDRVNVQGTALGVTTAIKTGAGNDVITAGSVINVIDTVHGNLAVDGEAGVDQLVVNDQGWNGERSYELTNTLLMASNTGLISQSQVESLVLNAGLRANDIKVLATAMGTTTTINAGAGLDTIQVGSSLLNAIQGAVTVDGQADGATLLFSDVLEAANQTYTITATTVARTGMATVTYRNVPSLAFKGGTGNDTFRFENFGGNAAVDGGAGTDRVEAVAGTFKVAGEPLANVELLSIGANAGLAGTGILRTNVVNAGVLDVGGASLVGTLNITGNYTQAATGRLIFELRGRTPDSQHDVLNIFGTATLGGTLTARLLNAFVPAFGDSFFVLVFASRQGNFATRSFPTLPVGRRMLDHYRAQVMDLVVR